MRVLAVATALAVTAAGQVGFDVLGLTTTATGVDLGQGFRPLVARVEILEEFDDRLRLVDDLVGGTETALGQLLLGVVDPALVGVGQALARVLRVLALVLATRLDVLDVGADLAGVLLDLVGAELAWLASM
ncbi:hypothetical protein [Saccharomonospora sp. CUA-673]|uniref:hypothetical protein n=1 Tax=Saccharomonospora sp. CUA-673 TaxID=1904969 RepID=UPI0011153FE9|nr:hypothetical protein [Saccharomonospora sp. CUA-673]